eukprot:COSAG01_NODE_1507_length_10090_cov_4.104694_8_plen_65_part_00
MAQRVAAAEQGAQASARAAEQAASAASATTRTNQTLRCVCAPARGVGWGCVAGLLFTREEAHAG